MVLVHIPAESGMPQRERFVVACATREEAEAKISRLYPPEQNVSMFALALSSLETEQLELSEGEIRRW